MIDKVSQLIENYGITKTDVANAAEVSRPLVSLVLSGKRADRRGVIDAALSLIEQRKNEEQERMRRLSALCENAA